MRPFLMAAMQDHGGPTRQALLQGNPFITVSDNVIQKSLLAEFNQGLPRPSIKLAAQVFRNDGKGLGNGHAPSVWPGTRHVGTRHGVKGIAYADNLGIDRNPGYLCFGEIESRCNHPTKLRYTP